MRYIYIALFGLTILFTTSCTRELEISAPEIIPIDTVDVLSGNEFFLTVSIGDTTMSFRTSRKKEATGTYKVVVGTCALTGEDSVQFYSYFSRVADTNHNEIVSFGLINCVPPNANGYRDSTYVRETTYPMGDYPDTTTSVKAFIEYIDADSVIWSSVLTTKGPGAQKKHSFVLETVSVANYVDAVFDITGSFTGWIYNGTGDSLLVSRATFRSKAWGF